MTDKEFYEYLEGNPTITGIVSHMKTWWSNEGTDKELQDLFDLIIKLDSNRWIPCSERLPKEDGRYLCDWQGMRVGTCYFHNGHFRVYGDIKDKYVTAWQKLPKPYEVKR